MTASAPETHCAPETPVISESSEEHGLFLDTLISRINQQLGKAEATTGEFCPQQPQSFEEAGVSSEEVEKIICKLLSARGALSGRKIAEHVGLSFGVMDELLRRLKNELVLAYKTPQPWATTNMFSRTSVAIAPGSTTRSAPISGRRRCLLGTTLPR